MVVGAGADVDVRDAVVVVCFGPAVAGVVGPEDSVVVDVSEEVWTEPEVGSSCETSSPF